MEQLNTANYRSSIQKTGTVIVDFWASWCGPCRMMNPILEQLNSEGKITVYKVNVDEQPQLASQFQVQSIPTILVYENGIEKGKIVGAMPLQQLKEHISKLVD